MTKWENNFIEEDIDLHVFLTLDDEDLKKIGTYLIYKMRGFGECKLIKSQESNFLDREGKCSENFRNFDKKWSNLKF